MVTFEAGDLRAKYGLKETKGRIHAGALRLCTRILVFLWSIMAKSNKQHRYFQPKYLSSDGLQLLFITLNNFPSWKQYYRTQIWTKKSAELGSLIHYNHFEKLNIEYYLG